MENPPCGKLDGRKSSDWKNPHGKSAMQADAMQAENPDGKSAWKIYVMTGKSDGKISGKSPGCGKS